MNPGQPVGPLSPVSLELLAGVLWHQQVLSSTALDGHLPRQASGKGSCTSFWTYMHGKITDVL